MVSSLELGFGSCNLSPRGSLDEKQASPRLQAYLEVTRLSASGPESLWEITSINFKRSKKKIIPLEKRRKKKRKEKKTKYK